MDISNHHHLNTYDAHLPIHFLVYTWNQKMIRYAYLGLIKEVTLNLKDLQLPTKVISHIPKSSYKEVSIFLQEPYFPP